MKHNGFVITKNDAALKSTLSKAAENAVMVLENSMPHYASGDAYPANPYQNGQYTAISNGDIRGNYWTEGFWTGQLWLAYELTGTEKFRTLAEQNVLDFAKRVADNFQIDWHHDTGFLYTPSCVSAYKLTGSRQARHAALQAAYSLARRFRPRGEFIQSMGAEIEPENYRYIIDTMMNIPLLFWATEETGDESYRDKAIRHAETTRRNSIREDGSTYHHMLMDFQTAAPKGGTTLQGLSSDSCWSRGQAWMIYGSALMYAYTDDASWIETFETVTDYFMAHLPENYIPHWDFSVMGTEDDERDSSAAAIAACGILEMARLTGENEKMTQYVNAAKRMMTSLIDEYAVLPQDGKEGLISGVVGAKLLNMDDSHGTYGDYFYLEMLVRALTDWKQYW